MALQYVCIQCGKAAENLFRRYSSELIEVCKCKTCGNVVDHYIEYDNVIIFIDSILLRIQAFRHLLYNSELRFGWAFRLFMLTSICEAYHHWAVEHKGQQAITAAIEVSFYVKLLSAFTALVLQIAASLSLLYCFARHTLRSHKDVTNIISGISLANCSILFVLVMHVWSRDTTPHSYYLLKLYKVATSFVSLKAVTGEADLLIGVVSSVSCAIDVYANTL